jgi:hypothetical protein
VLSFFGIWSIEGGGATRKIQEERDRHCSTGVAEAIFVSYLRHTPPS